MKKLILVMVIAASLAVYSCGNQEGTQNGKQTPATDSLVNSVGGARATAGAADQGSKLVAGNDCKTCHATDAKLIGPAYQDVANKYEMSEGIIDELATKIVQGGSGRWGTVPMTPHPNVTISDAREMARYILSLRTNK